MTSSYSKTCLFVRPHVNEKPKISTVENVFEKMRFRFEQICIPVDGASITSRKSEISAVHCIAYTVPGSQVEGTS